MAKNKKNKEKITITHNLKFYGNKESIELLKELFKKCIDEELKYGKERI